MELNDEIIDEATELAKNRILNDPSDATILDAVREIVGVPFADNSICARLALAAYNRMDNLRNQVESCYDRFYDPAAESIYAHRIERGCEDGS